MRDVAALAGVSLKTVSRVVNDEPGVSPDVRERVTAAVNRLDYRPNLAASNLRRTGARTGPHRGPGAGPVELVLRQPAARPRGLRAPPRHRGARGQPRRGRRPRAGARPRPGHPPGRRARDHARERAPGLPRQRAAVGHAGGLRRPPAPRASTPTRSPSTTAAVAVLAAEHLLAQGHRRIAALIDLAEHPHRRRGGSRVHRRLRRARPAPGPPPGRDRAPVDRRGDPR